MIEIYIVMIMVCYVVYGEGDGSSGGVLWNAVRINDVWRRV